MDDRKLIQVTYQLPEGGAETQVLGVHQVPRMGELVGSFNAIWAVTRVMWRFGVLDPLAPVAEISLSPVEMKPTPASAPKPARGNGHAHDDDEADDDDDAEVTPRRRSGRSRR